MGLTAVDSSRVSCSSDNIHQHQLQKRDTGVQIPQQSYAVDARLISEYYSSKSISFDYAYNDNGFDRQSKS